MENCRAQMHNGTQGPLGSIGREREGERERERKKREREEEREKDIKNGDHLSL